MGNLKSTRRFWDMSQKRFTILSLILFVVVLELSFLLNCCSVAVAMENTHSTPEIKLAFRTKVERIVYDNHSVLLTEWTPYIRILCTASYPIEWKPSSLSAGGHERIISNRSVSQTPQLLKTEVAQHFKSEYKDEEISTRTKNMENKNRVAVRRENITLWRYFNTPDFFYHLEISVVGLEVLGYLGSCQSTPLRNQTTAREKYGLELLEQKVDVFMPASVYFKTQAKYFFGGDRRFKILNRRREQTFKDGANKTQFLIPCPLLNASMVTDEPKAVNITLVQILQDGQENETILELDLDLIQSDYDPRAGFYLTGLEELKGVFVCLAQSTAEEEEEGGGSGLKKQSENVTLKKQSENVTFEFLKSQWEYQNQEREDWLDVTDDKIRDFPRKEKTRLQPLIRIHRPTVASCLNIGDNEFGSYEFSWTPCNTRVDCEAFTICFVTACGWVFNIQRVKHTYSLELDLRTSNGVYRCSTDGNYVHAYGFSGLDKIQYYANTESDEIPPRSALIQFRMTTKTDRQTENLELYTNELHSFECKALKFLFTEELIILAQYSNNTNAYFTENSISKYSPWDNKAIVTRVNVNLTSDMTGILCLAPWSNSTEWIEANISFVAKDVRPPKIPTQKPEEKGQVFYVGETQRYLSCEADGEPKPNFSWSKTSSGPGNIEVIEQNGDSGFSIKFPEGGTILEFPKIEKNHSGMYICEATNNFGTDRKTVNVQVKETGLSTSAIIGVAIGVTIFFLAFVFVLCQYFQTWRKLRNLSADEIDEFEKGNPDALKNSEFQGENAHLLPFNKDYEVPASEFSVDHNKILGSGEFGVVYGGKLRERDVAIKTTKSTTDVNFFKAFLKEIKVMTFIGQHPNVVQLLGTSTSRIRERIVFVMVELGVHGSLNSFLMKHKANFVATLSSSQLFNIAPEELISMGYVNIETTIRITTMDFVKWCGQIAAGMTHLASKKIIHGDLAPRNILLFDDFSAKITDFGLSRQLYSDLYSKTGKSPLPWRSLAPESLKYLQFSVKSDVWAFGVLAWEIFSLAAVPYSGLSWTEEFVTALERGLRLQKPKDATSEIFQNMCDCWSPEPEDRPEFEQLEKFYNDILRGNAPEIIYLTVA